MCVEKKIFAFIVVLLIIFSLGLFNPKTIKATSCRSTSQCGGIGQYNFPCGCALYSGETVCGYTTSECVGIDPLTGYGSCQVTCVHPGTGSGSACNTTKNWKRGDTTFAATPPNSATITWNNDAGGAGFIVEISVTPYTSTAHGNVTPACYYNGSVAGQNGCMDIAYLSSGASSYTTPVALAPNTYYYATVTALSIEGDGCDATAGTSGMSSCNIGSANLTMHVGDVKSINAIPYNQAIAKVSYTANSNYVSIAQYPYIQYVQCENSKQNPDYQCTNVVGQYFGQYGSTGYSRASDYGVSVTFGIGV